MEFSQLIKERRSIRSFEEKEVAIGTIQEIIQDAQQAPSWKNFQPARYYVASTPEMKEKVKAALPGFNQRSSNNAAYVVTTFVKQLSGYHNGEPANDMGECWGGYDLGLSNAYFILSARNHGLDTLIMGLRYDDQLRQIFNIPESEQIASVIALGYRSDADVLITNRKAVNEIAKFN